MKVLRPFNALIVTVFNYIYEKFSLSSQNDVNFRFDNVASNSAFLLAYKNIYQTQFLFVWKVNKKLENEYKIDF